MGSNPHPKEEIKEDPLKKEVEGGSSSSVSCPWTVWFTFVFVFAFVHWALQIAPGIGGQCI
jgi:hypothetical protein